MCVCLLYYIIPYYITQYVLYILPYSPVNPKFGQDWVRRACGAQLRSEVPRGLGFRGLGFRGLGFRILGFRGLGV